MPDRVGVRRIGIVFALRDELEGLLRMLSETRTPVYLQEGAVRWRSGQLEVTAVVGGVGADNCVAGTTQLLFQGAQEVICAGFAGGLDPTIQVGDIIVAERVSTRWDLAEPIECDFALSASLPEGGMFGYQVLRGDLVTSDTAVRTAAEKKSAREMTGALATDMESHAAARVCEKARVPFACIRCITDTAGQDLPAEVDELAVSSGLRRASIALQVPQLWPLFIRLRRQSMLAARNLGDALGMLMLRLVRQR